MFSLCILIIKQFKMKLAAKLMVVFMPLLLAYQCDAQTPVSPISPDFRVFPNPSKEGEATFVSLQGIKSDNLLVVVYDLLGREIFSKVEVMKDGGYLFTINNAENKLTTGVYLIIATSDDKYFSQKLIVK